MNYKIEKEFEHKGYKCVVIAQSVGHRCGYVGVPKGHRLYGVDFSDYDNELHEIVVDLDVHGGVTFAEGGKESKYPVESTYTWWFGFDTAHACDKKDYELIKELDPERLDFHMQYNWSIYGEVRDLNYCIRECEELAEQLKELE